MANECNLQTAALDERNSTPAENSTPTKKKTRKKPVRVQRAITPEREYITETELVRLTGRAPRTLQKDRFFGRGFPFYRVNKKILYDLAEVRAIIRAGRVDTTPRRNGSAA
jgi:hypothetical protein